MVKPFLKWAGGKRQLLDIIIADLPFEFKNKTIKSYSEPFIGGGAVFLYLIQNYKLDFTHINDINYDVYNCWYVIQNNLDDLINELSKLKKYHLCLRLEQRKSNYYKIRDKYNSLKQDSNNAIIRASLTIFLNKTCFNGLYRLNSQGKFNVPCGSYKNPAIYESSNLLNISKLIQNTLITNLDYSQSVNYIKQKTFFYLDPPYRAISSTSNFTAYDGCNFDDNQQRRLYKFINLINQDNFILLNNSDPKNNNKNDNFFDDLYQQYKIYRVKSKRLINSMASKRGNISELIIKNY